MPGNKYIKVQPNSTIVIATANNSNNTFPTTNIQYSQTIIILVKIGILILITCSKLIIKLITITSKSIHICFLNIPYAQCF